MTRYKYALPANIVPTNRAPHILYPLGHNTLNANSLPSATQAPSIRNPLQRKPQAVR